MANKEQTSTQWYWWLLVVLMFLTGACSGTSNNSAAIEPVETQPAASDRFPQSTPTAVGAPTPTPRPAATSTSVPTPIPDPLIVAAEDVATRYFIEVQTIADDARVVDLSEASRLEAQGGPMEDYGLRLVASLLESNHYLPFDPIRWEVVGTDIRNPSVGAVDVTFCVQHPGIWRDFDTDDVTRTGSSDRGTVIYEIRRDGAGGMKVWAIKERFTQPCEFGGTSS